MTSETPAARLDRELTVELDTLRTAGAYKHFNVLRSAQGPIVNMAGHGPVLVLSSNNYLGLADREEVIDAGIDGLRRYGAGTASVRFICGTYEPHLELEAELAAFVGTEAALTYGSCWNANAAAIQTLSTERTAILSDELNHASIIDAIRLTRAERKVVYPHASTDALCAALEACAPEQRKLIVTDSVFSMEGDLAPLREIVALAREHCAILVVDDSHGTGVVGATGRGAAEHWGLLGKVDVITSTLGKALGGASGGFVAASRAVIDTLAQRSRPQLFSNALPTTIACSAREALAVLRREPRLVGRLRENTRAFRATLVADGFQPIPGDAAIIPILVGETRFAKRFSERLLEEGVFVTGFGYPVVPEGTARLRVQMSAALTGEHLQRAHAAFVEVGRELGVIGA
jgi:glycine C-acetyltransferase